MSRLYTALERSNSPLPEPDPPEAEVTKPSTPSSSEAPIDAPEAADLEPSTNGEAASRILLEVETTALPPLLMNTSPSFRREMALLYRSVSLTADGNLQSVLFCSPESGAGTSSIALNLAAYAGEETKGKALLIEANVARPFLRQWSGRPRAGFSDFLANQGTVEQYIHPATTPGLQVMTAGRVSLHSETLIQESRIRYLLTELHNSYPLIVLDGAPPAESIGTLEIAKVVDGVVLVVRPNTLVQRVTDARNALDNVGAKILGFAFSDF
jgi:Mrp family chromosome partitioning ATPase